MSVCCQAMCVKMQAERKKMANMPRTADGHFAVVDIKAFARETYSLPLALPLALPSTSPSLMQSVFLIYRWFCVSISKAQ